MKRSRCLDALPRLAAAWLVMAMPAAPAVAGPNYEPTRAELEQVREDLARWLPGSWDSFPQVYYERTVQAPKQGEHEHWHRVFARIDAPQIGTHVFYGQINVGGRRGEMMPRSQIIYDAKIDEARGVVSITGQGPAEPEKYENLQDKPALWKEVRQRDPATVRCDFVWRRSGTQIVGTLEGKQEAMRKFGPGTCTYQAGGNKDVEFFADAEWVLGPEDLWLYDINRMAGHTFVGRDDRTHLRLSRAHPFTCRVRDAAGERRLDGHDRGFLAGVTGTGGRPLEMLLLRAELPAATGPGLAERLRLGLHVPGQARPATVVEAAATADRIELRSDGVDATCVRSEAFAMPVGP
jgi:hypothetical protein